MRVINVQKLQNSVIVLTGQVQVYSDSNAVEEKVCRSDSSNKDIRAQVLKGHFTQITKTSDPKCLVVS